MKKDYVCNPPDRAPGPARRYYGCSSHCQRRRPFDQCAPTQPNCCCFTTPVVVCCPQSSTALLRRPPNPAKLALCSGLCCAGCWLRNSSLVLVLQDSCQNLSTGQNGRLR